MSTNSSAAERSLLLRFCDSFLHERNIKWLLVVGMLILLGSSVLLVSAHWDTSTPLWKYLIFLAYTSAIFAVGQWTRHRLALVRTGTVLQVLTLLLLPVTFLVLHWVQREQINVVERGLHFVLIGVNLTLAVVAARRIFHHFLLGHQPTFVASYLMLSLAGAFVPGLPEAWSPVVALALWAVFAAGSVKVNRHVFWLTEEHRAPRVFGFFPILLLGAQFFMLFALHAPLTITLDWLGFGVVLVAIPILLTADAVVRVFQQRTGDVVRPIPWPIIGPLGLGLVLCAAGLVMSGTGLIPPNRPHALVLTAALAGAMMAVVARRTGKQAFVWAMLFGILLAYNFSPAFFVDLARATVQQGAIAVDEPKLPYAFYGLTYLPLLAVLICVSRLRAKAGDDFVAGPMRSLVIALSCLLVAASFGHAKALFPVAACMTLLFSFQIAMFRDGRLAVFAVVSWIIMAAGITPFAEGVLHLSLPANSEVLFLALASGVLLAAGPWLDRRIAALVPKALERNWGSTIADICKSPCRSFSLLVTVALCAFWLAGFGTLSLQTDAWPVSTVLGLLLFTQALHWNRPLLGGMAIFFANAMLMSHALAAQIAEATILAGFTGLLLGQWLLSYLLERSPTGRVSQVFGPGNRLLASSLLLLLLAGVYLPLLALQMLKPMIPELEATWVSPLLEISWLCPMLMVAWTFDAARRRASWMLAALGCVAALGFVGAQVVSYGGAAWWPWLPAAWAATALIAVPVGEWLQRRALTLRNQNADERRIARHEALSVPINYATFAVFAAIAVGSLFAFPMELRVAGGLSVVGLLLLSVLRRQPDIRLPALILINWQVICLAVLAFGPPIQTLFELRHVDCLPFCLPVAFAATAGLLLWESFGKARSPMWEDVLAVHVWALRVLGLVTIAATIVQPALSPPEVILAAGAFAFAIAAELIAACRQQREERVWIAEVLALALAGYFAYFGVIRIGRGTTMFVVLVIGVIAWIVGESAKNRRHIGVLTRPLQLTATLMPMLTVGIGVYRHLFKEPVWLGANSLALLLAAGFYFWRGLERPSKRFLLLAGLIFNIALALLWRELVWTDPQFFMIPIGISILAFVQLLRRELPERVHDPLRYLGALIILVSPTFHIVGGSWVHLFSLMVASVAVVLVAIGLRVRALMYTGTAFLVADLVAMVVRGSVDNPSVLWIAGLGLGAAVIALGALCERNREEIVARMHVLADTLKQWH